MKTYLSIFVFAIIGLCSCETVIEIDIPEEPSKLVVNSYFSSDSLWEVNVSASEPILSAEPLKFISDANVTITDSDGTSFKLEEVPEKKGVYRSDALMPESGRTYNIQVSAAGFTTVTSRGAAPTPVEITSIDTSTSFVDGFPETEILINFQDPASERNFYLLKLFYVQKIVANDGDTFTYQEEVGFALANDDIFSSGTGTLLEDTPFNGRNYTIGITTQAIGFIPPNDSTGPSDNFSASLIIELQSTSEEMFQYESSIFDYETSSGDPFAQPAQVYSNIDNGFGIFAGFSASRRELKLR